MRSSLVVLAMILVSCHALAYGKDQMKELSAFKTGKLVGMLESVRGIIQNGSSSLNIPILDPFITDQIVVDAEKEGLYNLDGLLKNVHITGLSNYVIEKGDYKLIGLKVEVALSWPEINADWDYVGTGLLADAIDFYGEGHLTGTVKNVATSVNLKIVVRDGKVNVDQVDTKFSLESLDLNVTGLYYDEELSSLLSKLVSELVPELVDDYQTELMTFVNKILTDILNNFLGDKSLKDLLDLLG